MRSCVLLPRLIESWTFLNSCLGGDGDQVSWSGHGMRAKAGIQEDAEGTRNQTLTVVVDFGTDHFDTIVTKLIQARQVMKNHLKSDLGF